MGFINFMKGLIRGLFPVKDIKTALNIELALSSKMLEKIELWQKCYSGSADWLNEEKGVSSLRLEQSVVREFSNITLNEMTASVTLPALDELFNKAIRNINMHLQKGLATGAMVIKPLGEDKVQYVSANAFLPVEFDVEGRLIKVIFPETKKLKDKYYTRLEFHDLDYEKGLTITNKAYVSASPNTLGREISLDTVAEWKNLEENVSYPLMKRPAFGYYRNPIENNIDGSHCGVSVFDSALEIISKADKQFGRLDWEFESGERAVHIDEAALKEDGKTGRLNERLYVGLDLGEDELYKEFSPQFRQNDLIAGLEEYKRNIEFEVGLSYGDISNPQTVDKTATEIKSAKKRKYNTVSAIQQNLKDCLEDLVYALAFYNGMATQHYEFICDFKDSILVDDETERQQDRSDVNMGVMRLEEYRSKWYGEPIEEALKNLPQTADVIDDSVNVNAGSSQPVVEVQNKSLNGAQTQSLIAIMAQYSSGTISEGQAIALISTAIGISKEEARSIINGEIDGEVTKK